MNAGKVSRKLLDELVQKELGERFSALGYRWLRGVFFRELEVAVRHLVIFDFVAGKRVFFVIVGANSPVLTGVTAPDEAGAYVSRYLTPGGGLSDRPAAFRATDRQEVKDSLHRTWDAFARSGSAWLATLGDLASLADALPDSHDLLKGKLLLAQGNCDGAKVWLEMYLKRIAAMPQDAEVLATTNETKALLASCSKIGSSQNPA